MKLALVTTPPQVASGIGDYARHLLPELSRHAEISLFVEDGKSGGELLGRELRPARALDPRAHDHVLFQLGNEVAHAFMKPLLLRCGGTVVLHDWILFDMTFAAHPALARGGLKGLALAFREGDAEQARVYVESALAQRSSRRARRRSPGPGAGTLLDGWHAPEAAGRWTSDVARLRLEGSADLRVRIALTTEPGRRVEVACQGRSAAATASEARREAELELDLRGVGAALIEITSAPVFASEDQRRHGDTRRLGSFVRRITVSDAAGERELDLGARAAAPAPGWTRDRFRLPLNRRVVLAADSFIVHSEFMRARVLAARGHRAPIGVVRHGAEPRWSDEPRTAARARLGLAGPWREGVLITSFGSVQVHKRIEPLLAAFALARARRADLHLALIGAEDRETLDVPALVRELGLETCVRLTGRVAESEAWTWIHAGDFAVQLRGPSTGGSSGGVFQSLALGRAVIASDQDEQRELPGACTLRVAPGEGEVEALCARMLELASDPGPRRAMEQAARAFVERECAWSRVAEAYAEHLRRFPRPRGK